MARLSEIRRRLGLSPALLPRHQLSSASSSSLKGDKNKKGKQCGCSLLSSPSLTSVTSIILAAGTLALFTSPLLQSFRIAAAIRIQGIQEYDAVIVGAGWAGISAADTLLKGGVENILVLEANDYIGGRYVSM